MALLLLCYVKQNIFNVQVMLLPNAFWGHCITYANQFDINCYSFDLFWNTFAQFN